MQDALAGRGIVITRPSGQAAALAKLVEERGGRAILFPVIEIIDVEDRTRLESIVDRLDTFDTAIFISQNAIAKGWAAIHARRALPKDLKIAAIGRGSARALGRLGVESVIAPEGADSESLLALPEFAEVEGRRIVIFRGVGGRELLRETLEARGATVEYAECYRRIKPQPDVGRLIAQWDAGEVDALIGTSSEALRNLRELLGNDAGRVASRPLFVPHPRIAASARELGFGEAIVTPPGDAAIAAAIAAHFAR